MIRFLVYPIQFDRDPRREIERVLELVVGHLSTDSDPRKFLNAIDAALRSNDPLAELIPQNHSEKVIRDYLAEMGEAIADRWKLL